MRVVADSLKYSMHTRFPTSPETSFGDITRKEVSTVVQRDCIALHFERE